MCDEGHGRENPPWDCGWPVKRFSANARKRSCGRAFDLMVASPHDAAATSIALTKFSRQLATYSAFFGQPMRMAHKRGAAICALMSTRP
jgi:hypothetical protein